MKSAEFDEGGALTPQDWERVLNIWQQQEREEVRDPQVMAGGCQVFARGFSEGVEGGFCHWWNNWAEALRSWDKLHPIDRFIWKMHKVNRLASR